ncbi:MAG: DUF3047 domain-containing protein [Burkholderiaceae bacterium]|nr:DUF3047 domain-containing protein [Sulfuritalea sp.]MCF8176224.1 DUF3047 domain-containing protein [Burkholderiaceae bacterium]
MSVRATFPIVRIVTLALAFMPALAAAETLKVGDFDAAQEGLPAPWRVEQIDKKVAPTRYRLRAWDGVSAVEAHAVNSMALLARPLTVDLARTPILCWRWRVESTIATADMTKKSGDDFAARLYLSFDMPADKLGLLTRASLGIARSIYGDQVPDAAVNYVWDNRQAVGTVQDNAYTDRARMFVLRSGDALAGKWVNERRNVAEDFQRAFGHAPARLHGLALASDTDNTGAEARAGFAEIRFVDTTTACPDS